MSVEPVDLLRTPPCVRVFGDLLFLHTRKDCPFLSRVLMQGQLFEPFETLLIRREVRPGDVVLDVGANIGYYTVQFARLVGSHGKVIAFEPDPANFALLKRNVEANGFTNVELASVAVSNRCGRMALYHSPTNPGDHRLFEGAEESRRTTEVDVTTLDAFFRGRNPRVDFIKMDIQGGEWHAIKGAHEIIAANPFLKLVCEFWPAGLRTAGCDPRALLGELRRLEFCPLEISEANGRLLPLQPKRLLEELPGCRPDFTNLYGIKTTQNAGGFNPPSDLGDWKVWHSPQDLRLFERKVSSQNGEDGIIEEIFRRIGVASKTFVEFGSEDGKECNAARLIRESGWRGLFIEGDRQRFSGLEARYARYPEVKLMCAAVTSRNVEQLFAAAGLPNDFDLLSIDIDGNDYWVWKAISSWRPRVVVIETNSHKRPPERWIMPENDEHVWSGTDYYGASLAALRDLGREKGYQLVGCDSRGVNAFFVRADLAVGDMFLDPELSYHFSPSRSGAHGNGHPPDQRR